MDSNKRASHLHRKACKVLVVVKRKRKKGKLRRFACWWSYLALSTIYLAFVPSSSSSSLVIERQARQKNSIELV